MGPFLPWFSFEVEHEYFAPSACTALAVEPAPLAADLLQRCGCVVRNRPDGLAVFLDHSRLDALHRRATDAADPMVLHFTARAVDPWLAAYTAGMERGDDGAPGTLIWLDSDSAAAAPDADGRHRLHDSDTAGTAQRVPLAGAGPAAALSARDQKLPPALALRLRIAADGDDADDWRQRQADRRWLVRLQARRTHWRYYLPAEWAADDPRVIDPGGIVEFEPPAPVALAGGRRALSTRSRSAIALHARPAQRFQLRTRSAGAERVLVKRLPVASAEQLNVEWIDGVRTLVSEIYVNR